MKDALKIKLYTVTLDCKDPHGLAIFYAALLKWEIAFYDEDWACVGAPGTNQGTYPCIMFQRNPAYQAPVWPEKPEAQQQILCRQSFGAGGATCHPLRCKHGRGAIFGRLEGDAGPIWPSSLFVPNEIHI